MKQVNLYEAKTNLSQLVEDAAAGEEIIIAKNGKPVARLVKIEASPKGKRKLGFWEDEPGWIADDFDAPDPEIERLFYEGDSGDKSGKTPGRSKGKRRS